VDGLDVASRRGLGHGVGIIAVDEMGHLGKTWPLDSQAGKRVGDPDPPGVGGRDRLRMSPTT
jgi:hypothetical protein